MKRIIIVGSTGQDGGYLLDRFAAQGAVVLGISRESVQTHGQPADFQPPSRVDLLDPRQISSIVTRLAPHEVYYLAAHHHSAEDRGATSGTDLFHRSFQTHVVGLVNILDAIVQSHARTRVFYAASSHVFGEANVSPQDEQTPFAPRCIYGITKTTGIHCCRFYRQTHGVHASVGILYNHESPRRRADFLTRKVTRAVAAIARGKQSELVLGDLEARVDWGYAPDYADAMTRITDLPNAGEFIIATGRTHSVRDFVSTAFACAGLDWNQYVRQDPSLIAKVRQGAQLVGDATKLKNATEWSPSVSFEEMISILVRAEMEKADD